MRNANYIVHQKIALMQMRQAVLLCYLQILRQFFIVKQDFTRPQPLPSRAGRFDGNSVTEMDVVGTDPRSVRNAARSGNAPYDQNNQITGVNVPYAGNVSYDAYQWTRPTNVTLPSGSGAKQYAYDELMRTKTITSSDPSNSNLMNYQYTYDKMDNIKTRNTQAGNYAYNYDNLYRLNEGQKDTTQTEAYTYDQVGNRLTSKETTGDWKYNNNNELLSYNGTTNQYDANGNTIQRNVNGTIQNFIYDVDNRLIEVRDASNNLIASYTYDPFGRRIKKSVSPAGGGQGVETFYLYSDEGLIGEYDNSGNQIRIYGYKPNSTWSTDPLFMREGGNIYFYHNDHLGTPKMLTDISGNVVWSASYDAFGKASVDAASTITNNLRFPGQYFDAETGWHYNYHRYYDSETGRYVTEDPIGLGGNDVNIYRYVLSNPINFIDPLGLDLFDFHYYKRWGGPGYTAGMWTSWDEMPEELREDIQRQIKEGWDDRSKYKPLNEQDNCYMHHDICCGEGRMACREQKRCYEECRIAKENKCDKDLRNCLIGLGFTDRALDEAFRIGAISAFYLRPAFRNAIQENQKYGTSYILKFEF